ncbi:MAG: hypothetical protein K1X74_15030 [Pirellulales bacterium]|nr:hypothetical protein [Pirellulales bacterium]
MEFSPITAATLIDLGASRPPEPGASTATLDTAVGAPAGPPSNTSDTFREILGHYDITHITPREFTEMIQKLHAAGVIDDAQFRELSLVRLDLDAAGVDPEEPVDLLELHADQMNEQQRELSRLNERAKRNPGVTVEATQALATLQTRMAWLQKFARVQSGVEPQGIDLVA